MTKLAHRECVPCRAGAPPISDEKIALYQPELHPDWMIVDRNRRLERVFSFPDFASALAFTNKVAAIVEKDRHHPTILTSYGRVKVKIWTMKIHALHDNDFILAAKIDRIPRE